MKKVTKRIPIKDLILVRNSDFTLEKADELSQLTKALVIRMPGSVHELESLTRSEFKKAYDSLQ